MKNYKDSDYAHNKFSKGIVYNFADSRVEVTLEDYLAENPDGSEEDFQTIKALSDQIYLDQVTEENAQTYKNVSLHSLLDVSDATEFSPQEQLEVEASTEEEAQALRAVQAFLRSGKLTLTQRKRFALFYIQGLSTRQIAVKEGVSQRSIMECLQACEKKMKEFLKKYPLTPPKNCIK